MKTELPKESKDHQEAIFRIRDTILEKHKDKISHIILYGSFARGDWVHDIYDEDGITYEYSSDYDILIIAKNGNQKNGNGRALKDLHHIIDKSLEPYCYVRGAHTSHTILESIKEVNQKLENSRYFYVDIKKEGVLLYDSKEFELAEPNLA